MKTTMKIRILIALVLGVFIFNQCDDASTGMKDTGTNTLDKQVGERIDLSMARRWIDRYQAINPGAREDGSFTVTSEQVDKLIDQANGLGVVLHHAIDGAGEHHILVLPIAQDLVLWGANQVLDANTNTLVSRDQIKGWADNYSSINTSIKYHFFGMDVFNEILSNSTYNTIDIVPAINDQNEPQLVLIAKTTASARSKTFGEDSAAFDLSSPCPAVCNLR